LKQEDKKRAAQVEVDRKIAIEKEARKAEEIKEAEALVKKAKEADKNLQ